MIDTKHPFVLFGTQRAGPGTGFSRATFDTGTGTLGDPELVAIDDDPSFFVVHPDGQRLYTCNSGTPGGVTAYAIRGGGEPLRRVNHHVSAGRGPSQLSLDRSGRFVLAANYGGGYIEVLAIESDGSLGKQTAFVQHQGRSTHPERQTRPYAHCVATDPSNRFALAADLGTDEVLVYRFAERTGALSTHDPSHVNVRPGSGPRHLAWHPSGGWVYLIEELSNEVTTFRWDGEGGTLTERQTVPTLPTDFAGESTAAEILVHPSGHFVYASNRGHDSVAIFAVDPSAGTLTFVERVNSDGRTPRYMAFDPTGAWLVVANCDSDSAAVFRIDRSTGRLRHHASVPVPRPYGIAFAAMA